MYNLATVIEDRRDIPSGKSLPISRFVDTIRDVFGNPSLPTAEHFSGSLIRTCYLPVRYDSGWLSLVPYTLRYTGIRVLASSILQHEGQKPFIGSNIEIQYLADAEIKPAGTVIGEQFVQTGRGNWDHVDVIKAADGEVGGTDSIEIRTKGVQNEDLKRGVAVLRFVDNLHFRDRIHTDKVFDPKIEKPAGVLVVRPDPKGAV